MSWKWKHPLFKKANKKKKTVSKHNPSYRVVGVRGWMMISLVSLFWLFYNVILDIEIFSYLNIHTDIKIHKLSGIERYFIYYCRIFCIYIILPCVGDLKLYEFWIFYIHTSFWACLKMRKTYILFKSVLFFCFF